MLTPKALLKIGATFEYVQSFNKQIDKPKSNNTLN